MIYNTTILPERWDVAFISEDKQPLIPYRVLDYNGNEFDDYIPTIEILPRPGVAPVAVFGVGDQLSKEEDSAVTEIDLDAGLAIVERLWCGVIELSDGETVTLWTGKCRPIARGQETGTVSGLGMKSFKLPLLPTDDNEAGYVWVDDEGNPILNSDNTQTDLSDSTEP